MSGGTPDSPMVITAKPFTWPPEKVVHRAFNAELIVVDKDMQKALFLSGSEDIMMLDPRRHPQRLDIGEPQPGEPFWIVGKPVEVIKGPNRPPPAGAEQPEAQPRIRIVYRFRRVDRANTKTLHAAFEEGELAELRKGTQTP